MQITINNGTDTVTIFTTDNVDFEAYVEMLYRASLAIGWDVDLVQEVFGEPDDDDIKINYIIR